MIPMEIAGKASGPLGTVSYLVRAGAAWVLVDPSYGALAAWERELPENAPQAIWLTHGHFDHVAGLAELTARWPGVEVSGTELTAGMCADPRKSGAALFGMPQETARVTRVIAPGDMLTLGETTWRVIGAEGHCPGSVMFYCAEGEGHLLAGDVLFAGSVGRWDLPGADYDLLAATMRERVMTLPDTTRVYPGHGEMTSIGEEREGNWIVQQMLAGRRVGGG